jgi:hypothetical protein
MADIQSANIEHVSVKKDITVLQLGIKRSKRGIIITAKADKIIEDLFASWSAGQNDVSPQSHGRMWEAPPNGALPPIYALGIIPDNGKGLTTSQGRPYRIDRVGVLINDDTGTNIGFLRFRGISEGSGITFVIKGVYSSDAVRQMAQDVREAVKHFYINFIKPIDVVVTMSTQEI